MKRPHLPTALLAVALLAGCGSVTAASGDATATDTASSATPTESPIESPIESPSASPTVGTYPAYPHDDYRYVLGLQCFCPAAGRPILVTVTDGEVVSAVWAQNGQDTVEGAEVGFDWAGLTLDDVIDAANDTDAAVVEVDWAEGADHPTSVTVDRDKMMMDEEITYLVSDVRPAG